jgi:riboflavin-specific deaminase-like protein
LNTPTAAPEVADPAAKSSQDAASWASVPTLFRSGTALPAPWEGLFGALRRLGPDGLMVIGQLGQSLDGRIATPTGHSHYINGPAGIEHLHRIRALVDVVLVGAGTAVADDPQLTVRRVEGPQPARAVLDPNGRLPSAARMFANDGVRRLVLTASEAKAPSPGVEMVALQRTNGQIEPAAILAALAERGLKRILIEGGADTVSRFIAAKCLDRLHVVVAPMILGSGRTGISLPPIEKCDEALRFPMHMHPLDGEVLYDCDLSAQRVPVGLANKSR